MADSGAELSCFTKLSIPTRAISLFMIESPSNPIRKDTPEQAGHIKTRSVDTESSPIFSKVFVGSVRAFEKISIATTITIVF